MSEDTQTRIGPVDGAAHGGRAGSPLQVHAGNPSPLLRAEPFQPALGRRLAFGLEGGAQGSKVLSSFEDTFAPDLEAVGSDEQIVHSRINSGWVISFWLRDFSLDGDVQEEPLVLVGEHGVGRLDTLEQFPLVFAYFERGLDPLLNRCDGGVPPVGLLEHTEEPSVEVELELVEPEEPVPPLLVCFGHPIPGADCEVRRQAEFGPGISVNHVVQGDGVEHPALEGDLGDVVAGIPKSLERGEELMPFLVAELKPARDGLGEPHQNSVYAFSLKTPPQFLPALKGRVSSRWSR